MKRKLIKLAEKTLVVSLPTNWLANQGLQKGDELELTVDDYRLILTPPIQVLEHKEISFDASALSERVLRWQISSLHKQGYDQIIITSYTPKQYTIIEDLVKNLFVGFIVKDKTALRIVIGQVAVIDSSEFDSTLRRAFRLLNTMFEELIEAAKSNNGTLLMNQVNHEHVNNKLTNFCERLLNKTLQQKTNGHFWYVIIWNLEKIADNFKYIAQHYDKDFSISVSTQKLLSQVASYEHKFYSCFYDFSFKQLTELSIIKKELETTCLNLLENGELNDRILLHYLHMIILQLADFFASMIALKLPKE